MCIVHNLNICSDKQISILTLLFWLRQREKDGKHLSRARTDAERIALLRSSIDWLPNIEGVLVSQSCAIVMKRNRNERHRLTTDIRYLF